MGTITEIETAIEHLPTPQVDELAAWLEVHRAPGVRRRWLPRNG